MSETATAKVDHCTLASIGMEITGEDAPPLVESCNEYLSQFIAPASEKGNFLFSSSKCVKCERPISGALGSFVWGIVHGEGTCGNCGWPARAYHDIKHDGESVFDRPLQIVLQYHPDFVEKKGTDS